MIKYENMEYKRAVHQAHLVLDLCAKSKRYIRELFDPPDVRGVDVRLLSQRGFPVLLTLAVAVVASSWLHAVTLHVCYAPSPCRRWCCDGRMR